MEGNPPEDPFLPEGEVAGEAGPRGTLADGVKKAILAGVGALFLTEESARRLAREWKLPKDVIAFIGQQAQGAKDEVLRMFGDEIRRFLESETLRREFWRGLHESTIELRAEIRLRPVGEGEPRSRVAVKATRGRRRAKKARR